MLVRRCVNFCKGANKYTVLDMSLQSSDTKQIFWILDIIGLFIFYFYCRVTTHILMYICKRMPPACG